MNETESTNRSWIAGLKEHRIALGIALLASILLIVFMLRPSGTQHKIAEKDMHVMIPAHSTPASGQKGSEGPTYSIPEKPANQPQVPANPIQSSPVTNASPPASPAKASVTPNKAPTAARTVSKQAPSVRPKAAAHGYFVQVGSFHDLANARKEAARLALKGWSSSVASNSADLHTVRIGPVPTRPAAEKLRQRLVDKAKLKGFIVKG